MLRPQMKRQIIEKDQGIYVEKFARNEHNPTIDHFAEEEYNSDNEQMPSTSAAALNSTSIINFVSNSFQRQPQIGNNNEPNSSTASTLNISQIENNHEPGTSNSSLDITQICSTSAQLTDETENVVASSKSKEIRFGQTLISNGFYLSKIECLGTEANQKALSLFELIHSIRPIASIHFNFSVDPEWLLKQYTRQLRQCPISIIVGQSHIRELKAECDLKKLSNVQCAGAPLPFPYGTHHTKLSLFENESAIHVMISTANMVPSDWALKTQLFYHYRAPFQSAGQEENSAEESGDDKQCNFRDDLVEYLRKAYPKKSASNAYQLISYWLDRIVGGQTDFSGCKDRLIASMPGRFQKNENDFYTFGHMKLRKVLMEKFSSTELLANKTFIGQFSSIGSLGPRSGSWLCDEFLKSLSAVSTTIFEPQSLKLIFPTAENVRKSLEGYVAGLSLPYSSEVDKKQNYLREFLHQWKSDTHGRTLAMPHVKSYAVLNGNDQPQWLLVTSANLSRSAWGKLEKSGDQLFVRSYELGVLLCVKDHLEESLLLPFDLPLTKYDINDLPFQYDLRFLHLDPDVNGMHGAIDARADNTISDSDN